MTAAGQGRHSQSSLAGIPATLLCQLLSESRQHKRTPTVRTYIVIHLHWRYKRSHPLNSKEMSHWSQNLATKYRTRETSHEHSKAVPQPKGGRSLHMPMCNWLRMDEPYPLCTLGVPGKDSANSCTDSKQSFYFKQNSCASGILSRFTSKSGEYRVPS